MKALTFGGLETVCYGTVPDPFVRVPTDAIVKVAISAICGSDLHVYHGREKGLDIGTVMGHEFVGEVVALGKDTPGLAIGDKVVSAFTTNCGKCFYCKKGLTCRCVDGQLFGWVQDGIGLNGAQAEYVRVPLAASSLMVLPDGVGLEDGLFLGDIFSTGYFSADMAGAGADGLFVVVGCGPVGLMAIMGAKVLGCEKIYAVDGIPERLALASELGAKAINYTKESVVDIIKGATDGRGADGVMELVGSPAAGQLAMALVRPGGVLAVAGVHNENHFPFTPVQAYDRNLTYKVGRCPARHYMDVLLPLIITGQCNPASIISHRLPLEKGADGYRIFSNKSDKCTKVVLYPS